jgi:hypothetical protein
MGRRRWATTPPWGGGGTGRARGAHGCGEGRQAGGGEGRGETLAGCGKGSGGGFYFAPGAPAAVDLAVWTAQIEARGARGGTGVQGAWG